MLSAIAPIPSTLQVQAQPQLDSFKPDLNSHAPTFCREILDSLTFSGQLWDRDQNVVPRRGVKRSCPLRKSPIEWCYDRMPPRYRNINGAPSGVGPLVLVAGDRNTPP